MGTEIKLKPQNNSGVFTKVVYIMKNKKIYAFNASFLFVRVYYTSQISISQYIINVLHLRHIYVIIDTEPKFGWRLTRKRRVVFITLVKRGECVIKDKLQCIGAIASILGLILTVYILLSDLTI